MRSGRGKARQAAQPVHARKVGGEVVMLEMEVAGPERRGKAGGVYAVWDEL